MRVLLFVHGELHKAASGSLEDGLWPGGLRLAAREQCRRAATQRSGMPRVWRALVLYVGGRAAEDRRIALRLRSDAQTASGLRPGRADAGERGLLGGEHVNQEEGVRSWKHAAKGPFGSTHGRELSR